MHFITFQTETAARPGGLLAILVRLALATAIGIALLAILFVGFFVVLPLLLAGGIAASYYVRRNLRRRTQPRPSHPRSSQPRPSDTVIDAEYTVVDHR